MKYQETFRRLLRHSHLLRASMNLAYDRHQQLQQTLVSLGFSEMPTDQESFTRVQMQAARSFGGIETRMLLDAPMEVMKYHYGPLQVSLCLLYAMLEEYLRLIAVSALFIDEEVDAFRERHASHLQLLEDLRHSILYERPDRVDIQKQFVSFGEYTPDQLAIEGEGLIRKYLQTLRKKLEGAL